jgi:hypothetical protein
VTDVYGRTIIAQQEVPLEQKLDIDLSGYPTGAYFVTLQPGKSKVVKQVQLLR